MTLKFGGGGKSHQLLREVRPIINKQQWHFSLHSFLMISHSLEIFFKKSSLLTKSSTDINLWIQADTFSLVEKCTLSIYSLRFSLSFLLFAYSLPTVLDPWAASNWHEKKIHFALKRFSHIPLKYSTSCSNYCCLKPRVGKVHSCHTNGFFYKQKAQSVYLCFSHCCNAWRKSSALFEKEDSWKPYKSQHTHIVMEQNWNIALFTEMLF